MSKTFEGKFGTKATIICDSISEAGVRLTTFEIEVPRMVWAEIMTHRMFSRNAASSRAIPFNKMKEQLTARPTRFGKANPGMQDTGEDFSNAVKINDGERIWKWKPYDAWNKAKEDALKWSEAFYEAGYSKQVFNRLTEPFQLIKGLITATEFANFFWLRDDKAADPTLQELAGLMQQAYDETIPEKLKVGEYHLPYVISGTDKWHDIVYYADEKTQALTLEEAIKVSAARCAAVSYRNEDYGLEKCLQVYERLVGDERKHSSAMEHQATPMQPYIYEWTNPNAVTTKLVNAKDRPSSWEKGISHVDRNGQLWSGNFRGYIQHRKLIPGENYT